MIVPYDMFISAFLSKVTEYNFIRLPDASRQELVDGYLKRACSQFSEVCKYNISNGDDDNREFDMPDITYGELDEIIDIVSDGMVFQWFKQHMNKQENLENMLNTADFSTYSPAELTYRITNAYKMVKRDFIMRIREYSFRHSDLTVLHQ